MDYWYGPKYEDMASLMPKILLTKQPGDPVFNTLTVHVRSELSSNCVRSNFVFIFEKTSASSFYG